jgi:hypothetical protein
VKNTVKADSERYLAEWETGVVWRMRTSKAVLVREWVKYPIRMRMTWNSFVLPDPDEPETYEDLEESLNHASEYKDLSQERLEENKEVDTLPVEVSDIDEFVGLSEKAEYCLVKRMKNTTKLKLRTSKELYTLMIESKKTEEVFKKLKCEIREI